MAFYSYIFSANYKRFFNRLKEVSKKENKNYIGMIFDTVYCVFRYGLGLTDYLSFQIYNKTAKERKEYVGTRMENKFYAKVSPSEYKAKFSMKPTFLHDFKQYVKRDYFVPKDGNYDEFVSFINKHNIFMAKPLDGLGGKGVSKENVTDIDDKKAYYDKLVENHMFLEEVVVQHPDLNKLCAKSVNTMRIMTFYNNGNPRILWVGLRVGNGVNSIDNFHAKGMAVNVDMETGKLIGNGIDQELHQFSEHPVTHVKFDGFQIPCFEEAKQLVLKAALESDKILVVGWDVAVTPEGPVLIEGNRRPSFDLVQVLAGRGRMDIVRSVLNDIDK